MWKLSKHIIIRLDERKITELEILSIVNQEVDVIIIPSDRDQ